MLIGGKPRVSIRYRMGGDYYLSLTNKKRLELLSNLKESVKKIVNLLSK